MLGAHVNLVGHGGKIIGTVAGTVGIGDDRLAALAYRLQGLAQFFHIGHAGRQAVGTQQHVLDGRVIGRDFQGFNGITHADGRHHLEAACKGSQAGGHGAFFRLLGQGERGEVHVQHPVARESAFCSRSGSAAKQHQHKQEDDELHDNVAADDGEHGFYKILHNTKCVAWFQAMFSL